LAAISSAGISGTVKLAPALADKAAPTDTVFIFARPAQGSKTPLAILKRQVKDLPAAFTLDDSMAMTPSLALSNFSEVIVGARVAKSGNAIPQSGDLEGLSPPIKAGATGLTIVIDRALP
jgi:cytochrome c-type biogenesis protein CcmH